MEFNVFDRDSVSDKTEKTKPEYRTLSGWSRSSLELGSPAYNRAVNSLQAQIDKSSTEMISFTENMAEWVDPSTAEKKMRQFNRMYCTKMINDCLRPLNDGLSGDAIVSTIGMFIGMSLFSKDFRDRCNASVANALMPHVKNRALKNAERIDKLRESLQKANDKLGFNFDFQKYDSNGNVISQSEIVNEKINKRWQRICKAGNQGREFITPEGAAVKYLGFCKQAYDMMRTDTIDMKELRENIEKAEKLGQTERVKEQSKKLRELENERNARVTKLCNKATNSLFKVASMDGVDSTDIQQNVMNVYGRIADKNPAFEKMFNQTALSQLNKKTYAKIDKDGNKYICWDGQYEDEGGVPFTGMLTPRKPMHRDECMDKIAYELRRCFDVVGDVDKINKARSYGYMRNIDDYFKNIISDDLFPYGSSEEKERHKHIDDFYSRVYNDSFDKWVDMETEPQRKAEAERMKQEEQQRAKIKEKEDANRRLQEEQRKQEVQERIRRQEARAERQAQLLEEQAKRDAEYHKARMEALLNGKNVGVSDFKSNSVVTRKFSSKPNESSKSFSNSPIKIKKKSAVNTKFEKNESNDLEL